MQITQKFRVFFGLGLILLLPKFGLAEVAKVKNTSISQAQKEDVALIKSIDESYKNAKSISMDLKKILTVQLLDKVSKTSGKVLFSKGRMRMEMDAPDKSLVVIDKKHIWVVNYPSAEFKNSAIQVIQAEVSTKKGRSQNFLGLLTQGGILKYFNVSGVLKTSDEEEVFFLQPNEATVEFKRAQMVIHPKTKKILSLKYWDELDNETGYEFSNVQFNQRLDDKSFVYHPPKNADITHF
jgi:outer membrane lipoprotein-sorting protein